ncbi:MAG: NAD-dependent DNA ligase LigA [Planctomycetota bacterium]|nr:NAD-dependent DNA ligase LigA [Planctomycetota bacterium]
MPPTIKEKIEQLRNTIRYHDRKYYVENNPEITDYEYDQLLKELQQLEKAQPELITPDSPTQRVGERPLTQFPSIEHKIPMLSIDNTYSNEELKEFDRRIKRMAGIDTHQDIEYVVELKIDGVAITLWYENGLFARGATRGDGFRGDDVTANLRTIHQIPLKLEPTVRKQKIPPLLEIRGEIYLPNKEFQRLNEEREEAGEPQFANPRNAAAGSLKLLDPRITAKRNLRIFTYAIGYYEEIELKTHMQCLELLRDFSFPVNPHTRLCKNIDAVIRYCSEWDKRRSELDYMVDGMVIKANSLDLHNQLGSTSKAPRWVISFKFQPEQAVTKIEEIVIQVGKTGALTPVANLTPVLLAGTTVSRATLHNFDEIRRKDIRVGDHVLLQKAGEIIPQVVSVLKEKRNGTEKPFAEPTGCPECKEKVSRSDEEVYLRCHNPLCQAQTKRHIQYFASRDAMDIEGLGPALIEQLVDKGFLKDYADVYYLKYDDLVTLERMGEKSSSNLISAIEESKHRDLDRLICALGINNVGSHTAEVLSEYFNTLDKLANAIQEELEGIYEIGPVIAKSIVGFFQNKRTREIIEKLKARGVNTQKLVSPKTVKNTKVSGKSFVITGTLQKYSRNEAETLIKSLGGRIVSSVSKKTDYLVAGEDPGSKLDKAGKLNVHVLDEEAFEKIIH